MKQGDTHIKQRCLTRLFKTVVEDAGEKTYFRQFFNGEPIHDWVEYRTDADGNQIVPDLLKELDIEDLDANVVPFRDEKPPF